VEKQKEKAKFQDDYAAEILNNLEEAIDLTATNPKLWNQLKSEIIQKSPDILEAILTATRPEFRVQIYYIATKLLKLYKKILEEKSHEQTLRGNE